MTTKTTHSPKTNHGGNTPTINTKTTRSPKTTRGAPPQKVARISDNKKAHHDFFINDKFECGIELQGWEVKSARAGNVNLRDSFVHFINDEAWLKNAHFSPYEYGDARVQDTRRNRRLLLHKHEITKIHTAVKTKGFTCVATKIYFNAQGRIKVEIAVAKGKHTYDKRAALKERDLSRETARDISFH